MAARDAWLRWVDDEGGATAEPVKALLTDGPLQGKPVEVEPVEGRPPMTIDLPDKDDGTLRYCLSELNQGGDGDLRLPLRRLGCRNPVDGIEEAP